MNNIIPGRFTADVADDFVVFLIGMRINNFLAIHKGLPVAKSMGQCCKDCIRTKKADFLAVKDLQIFAQPASYSTGVLFDDLERFSKDPGATGLHGKPSIRPLAAAVLLVSGTKHSR